MLRRLATVLALLAATVLLGGCVVIQSVSSEQQGIVGKLRVTVTFCASGNDDGDVPPDDNEDHPGCFDRGNSNQQALGGDTQLLLGLRVPVGTTAPDTVTGIPGPTPPAAGPIVFQRSPGYEAELQALTPAPDGTVWVGYVSSTYAFDDGADEVPAQSVPVPVDLGLPRPADGGPYLGPLSVRPVVGARSVSATLPADRPVECGDDPFKPWPRGGLSIPETICVDSPIPAGIPFGYNLATRDFGIVGGNATASPGQTVQMPFRVRGAGALPAGLTATLSASTALPGVAVTPSQPTAAISNGSDTRVTVPVAIPKQAGPGTYDVTLTGRLDNGQTRSTSAKLTVRDRQAPALTKLRLKPKSFKPATKRKPKRGTKVSFTLSEAASVKATVQRCSKRKRKRCVRYRTLKGSLTKTGVKGANSFRFDGRLRGKALKPGAYRLAVVATDAAGNRAAAVRAAFAIRG